MNTNDPILSERPIHALSFVSLDLETTGLAPGYDRVLEIAALRFQVRPDGSIKKGGSFHAMVDPERKIPPFITGLTGIGQSDIEGASPMAVVLPKLIAFLQDSDVLPTVLVAHQVSFDLGFLVAASAALNLPAFSYPAICTLRIAREVLPKAPRYTLEALVSHLELAGEGAAFHRAEADALHTRNLFARCVANAPILRLGSIRSAQFVPVPRIADLEVEVPERLTLLIGCIESGRRAEICYRGGSQGRDWRPVTPLGFYAVEGVVYLRALCHLDQDLPKSFRASRVSQARVSEE